MKIKRFKALEVANTSLTLYWGALLALPYQTFEIGNAYIAFGEIANEPVWAVSLLALGVALFLSMLCNKYKLKRISLLISTGLWFFISAAFAFSNPLSTGSGAYTVFACLTGWLFLKVGAQRREKLRCRDACCANGSAWCYSDESCWGNPNKTCIKKGLNGSGSSAS